MPKPPIFPLPNTTYFPVSFRHYAPRVSPTGGAVFTPPQAAPSAAMFSLPNDGFPSLLSRYFSALQSGAPVTAGPQAVCRTPLPFPAVFAVSDAFFGNSVLLLPDLCVYFAQSIQRKRRDKPAGLSLRSSVTDIRRKDDELPSLDIVFFQLILQAGAWDPQPGRCVHDLPVAGLHGR